MRSDDGQYDASEVFGDGMVYVSYYGQDEDLSGEPPDDDFVERWLREKMGVNYVKVEDWDHNTLGVAGSKWRPRA